MTWQGPTYAFAYNYKQLVLNFHLVFKIIFQWITYKQKQNFIVALNDRNINKSCEFYDFLFGCMFLSSNTVIIHQCFIFTAFLIKIFKYISLSPRKLLFFVYVQWIIQLPGKIIEIPYYPNLIITTVAESKWQVFLKVA